MRDRRVETAAVGHSASNTRAGQAGAFRFLVVMPFLLAQGLALSASAQGLSAAEIDAFLAGRDIQYDADGLIVHSGQDGGDTSQREGWYWLGVWIRANVMHDPWQPTRRLTFDDVLELLEPNGDGVFYRHPKLPPWNDPYDLPFGYSRDQMIPLVAAMGVWGKEEPLRRLWNALPQDTLGKHSFNGEWRLPGGAERSECPCTVAHTRNGDCLLAANPKVDCPLQENATDCGSISDLLKRIECEAQKGAANEVYRAEQKVCIEYGRAACVEAFRKTHVLTGDFIGPMTVNLFRRAWNEDPGTATDGNGPSGDAELLVNAAIRNETGKNRDDTDLDLNLTVMLLMAKLRYPSDFSREATKLYVQRRPLSYGSYLRSYYAQYGDDITDVTARMDAGIAAGWAPDSSGPCGAYRWYHRPQVGANPQLADMYCVIADQFLRQ